MHKFGKKYKTARESMQVDESVAWKNGLDLVVKHAYAKFDEAVDADIALGIDPTKGEQVVRGAVLLPHGTGKKVRVLVFAKGEYAEQARAAGADYVGLDDLIDKISEGWTDFEAAIATPDVMGAVGRAAKVLGPRGLLPNKKLGTVTFDVGAVVQDLKQGRVSYRNDKGGVLHISFGKVSFGTEKLLENFTSLIKAVMASRPSSAKGKYIRKITVSSTMGVGVPLNLESTI